MTKEKALEILKQACAAVVANLETHKQIQLALIALEEDSKKEEKPVGK